MKVKSSPVQGPAGSAGLTRFFDISGGGVQITPEMVIGLAVAFIGLELVAWAFL